MKNNLILKIVLTVILCTGIMYFLYTNTTIFQKTNSNLHESINLSEVDSITVNGYSSRLVDDVEKQNIVKAFNSILNIRENKDFSGTTSNAVIIIKMKTGKNILILNSGRDFEVQRYNSKGQYISYWGKQSYLRDILNKTS